MKFLLEMTWLGSSRAGIQTRPDLISKAHALDHYTTSLCKVLQQVLLCNRVENILLPLQRASKDHLGKEMSLKKVVINAESTGEPLRAPCPVD